MALTESSKKISFEESLGAEVVNTENCAGCGACVVTCPFKCLEYRNNKPVLVKDCKTCGICPRVCPHYHQSPAELEKYVFGRKRSVEEEFGIHLRLAVVQARDKKIIGISQDGGLVTSLLSFALENKLIDSAVVSAVSPEKPFLPIPKLATTTMEILECAGSRYFCSPNLLALNEAVKQKKTGIAFVGTPCHIQAIRKIQRAGLKKLTTPMKYLIGLMCSECFTYEGLMEKHIQKALGVRPDSVRKMNIKGKMIVTTDSGVHAIPLAEIRQYARKNCSCCNDFSSELADISVGGLGMNDWTLAVIRTKSGQELFEAAEKAEIIVTRDVTEEPFAMNLLQKLSKKKRQNPVL